MKRNAKGQRRIDRTGTRACGETLESRQLLDATGLVWAIDERVSVSFAPDGTGVTDHQSDLFAKLNTLGEEEQWQEAILRGFQTWAHHANVDVALKDDDGSPFGISGATTGDERFGDVRIAAIPMDSGIFATSVPTNKFVDGTWVGDILFNSNASIESLDELFAISVHEAGHILGVEHSTNPLSPMFAHDIPTVIEPLADDIAQLIDQYGARLPDAIEQREQVGDGLEISLNPEEPLIPTMIYSELDSPDDLDTFIVQQQTPFDEPLTVRLITDQISQLRPTLRVKTIGGQFLGEASYADQTEFGQTLVLSSFYVEQSELVIEISADSGTAHDVGAYTLIVSQGKPKPVPPSGNGQDTGVGNLRRNVERLARSRMRELSSDAIADFLRSQLNGSLPADETLLVDEEVDMNEVQALTATATNRFDVTGAIARADDQDRHQLWVPDDVQVGTSMFVSLVSLRKNERFRASLNIQQAGMQRDGDPLIHNAWETIVEVNAVTPGEAFELIVGLDPESQVPRGNYELMVRFGASPPEPDVVEQATIESGEQQVYPMQIERTQLFRFGLAEIEDSGPPTSDGDLNLRIIHLEDEHEHFVLHSTNGEFTTGTILLPPGEFEVRVETKKSQATGFQLTADAVDEPLGVEPIDPTEQPFCGFQWLDEWLSCFRVLGDTNGDGQVDFSDFLILSGNFGSNEATRAQGDLNDDKVVNFADFLILSGRFGEEPIYEETNYEETS